MCRSDVPSASSVGAHSTEAASNSATMTTTIITTAIAAAAPARFDEAEGLFAEVKLNAQGLEVDKIVAVVGIEVGTNVGFVVEAIVGLAVKPELGLVVGVAVGSKVRKALEERHSGVTDSVV